MMVPDRSTVIINMVLAPFLIFGWLRDHPLGVAGAAIATLIAGRRSARRGCHATSSAAKASPALRTPRLEAAASAMWGAHAQRSACRRAPSSR